MPMITDIGQLIATDTRACGGRPGIAGSRITVQYVITEVKAGQSPEEILEDKPYLSLASIHAAIAYYYANKIVLDIAFADEAATSQRLMQDMMATKAQR